MDSSGILLDTLYFSRINLIGPDDDDFMSKYAAQYIV
jgi:hypothetical protein